MARGVSNHLTEHQKMLIKKLDEAAQKEGHNRNEMFTMFLEMAYNAIKKTTCLGPVADKCEADYMAVIGRMKEPKRTAQLLGDCLGIVTLALEEDLHDFLGPIFMETVSNPNLGQFFTPDSLSYMMAELVHLPNLVEALEGQDYVTASEPAAGTGGIVMAAIKCLASRNIDFSRRLIWQITELDHRAYMGCYIQLSLGGVNASVINGNTLTLETFDHAITPVRLLHPRPFNRPIEVRKRTRPKTSVPRVNRGATEENT